MSLRGDQGDPEKKSNLLKGKYMKKLLALLAVLGILAGKAFAVPSCASKLIPTFPPGQARLICSNFVATVNQDILPDTNNAYDIGSSSYKYRTGYFGTDLSVGGAATIGGDASITGAVTAGLIALPIGTVVAAATPANIAPIIGIVPTFAANGGVFLKTTPAAGTIQIIRNSGANTIKVYPDAAAAINGGSTGASVDLATLKSLICFAESTTAWSCTWGQGS